jgi:hypothetical protein
MTEAANPNILTDADLDAINLEFKIKKFKASGVDFVQVIGMALPAGTEVSFILPLNGMRGLAEAILEACDYE